MSSKIDETVQTLFKEILNNGEEYENKNRGVKRLQIPRYSINHSFTNGFPAMACKELDFHAIVTELIWFLRGDNDIEFLNKHGVNIWNKDAYNWHVKYCEASKIKPYTFKEFKELKRGSVGANYSIQWRDFNNQGIDQIHNLIEGMKKDIMSSRLLVEAWNPAQLKETALPPCHKGSQVIGVNDNSFWLDWNQRSVDTFLGLPFNIASYAVLSEILGKMTNLKPLGINGDLKCVHFYDNQYDKAKEYLKRNPKNHNPCELKIDYDFTGKGVECFNELEPDMFSLVNYNPDSKISVKMLAPKKI